jgi:hypothetical protein
LSRKSIVKDNTKNRNILTKSTGANSPNRNSGSSILTKVFIFSSFRYYQIAISLFQEVTLPESHVIDPKSLSSKLQKYLNVQRTLVD